MITLVDVQDAAARIAGRVLRTPALPSDAVSRATGAQVTLKLENLQAIGSFKERGAANRLALLSGAERAQGVVAMSAGNHAQAVARHAGLLGIAATIVMPHFTPSTKVTRTRTWGAEVVVTTRSRDKAEALLAAGAQWAGSAAEAAKGAACVALCVPDTPDVEQVLFGPDSVAQGIAPGALVIDFSTIAAGAAAGFAARMAEQGVAMLDSPVSGGPQGAIDGTLTCMVGGTVEAFAAGRALFEAVGRTLTHLGPAGSGQVCKSANQLLITSAMVAVAEALAMARKAGWTLP